MAGQVLLDIVLAPAIETAMMHDVERMRLGQGGHGKAGAAEIVHDLRIVAEEPRDAGGRRQAVEGVERGRQIDFGVAAKLLARHSGDTPDS
ncbi:MAG: hypothetical protein ABL879_12155 [Devosia sp.]